MAIYTAETTVLYRGFLISIQVEREREDRRGLKRTVRTEVDGYLTDTFDEPQCDSDASTTELNGRQVAYIPQYTIDDFRSITFETAYLDNHYYNWPTTHDPVVKHIRQIRMMLFSAPSPPSLSKQVKTTLETAQADIDQYIEDRHIDFDESELKYGLANTLSEPVEDIEVQQKTPTGEHSEAHISPDTIVDELQEEPA